MWEGACANSVGFLHPLLPSAAPAQVVDDGSVADGQLAATAVQRHNLHLGAGASEDFR